MEMAYAQEKCFSGLNSQGSSLSEMDVLAKPVEAERGARGA